ncbi:MAG TPA: pantetheine-phosphate adenylyltransferase [Spirochaetota bacterium]|nr:pantetheine-phosphate adenylyltransferase [Spirochaetota bacterium]HOM38946.1 pantetheine-phosphate adenylyltransferase [Spirochaetota bacterium]HPQ49204.1 pantetheine-phosphate adenylyltransferase [Spirochaetota bacterium]
MAVALYPGSFDPLTYGHLDIIKRASSVFNHILLGIITNPNKTPFFSLEERKKIIKDVIDNIGLSNKVTVDSFDGLMVNYAREKNIKVVIRGLRAVSDFEYELALSMMNKTLYNELETVFLMTASEYSFISSNLVKEVFKYGGDISNYVHPIVFNEMLKKIR